MQANRMWWGSCAAADEQIYHGNTGASSVSVEVKAVQATLTRTVNKQARSGCTGSYIQRQARMLTQSQLHLPATGQAAHWRLLHLLREAHAGQDLLHGTMAGVAGVCSRFAEQQSAYETAVNTAGRAQERLVTGDRGLSKHRLWTQFEPQVLQL